MYQHFPRREKLDLFILLFLFSFFLYFFLGSVELQELKKRLAISFFLSILISGGTLQINSGTTGSKLGLQQHKVDNKMDDKFGCQ